MSEAQKVVESVRELRKASDNMHRLFTFQRMGLTPKREYLDDAGHWYEDARGEVDQALNQFTLATRQENSVAPERPRMPGPRG